MNLLVDIGNSRIKCALDGDGGIHGLPALEYKPENLSALLSEHWKNLPRPERIFVSNVAGNQAADTLIKVCNDTWSLAPYFIRVEKEACGIINGYDDIEQLGVDRWLSMIAAWSGCHSDVCIVGCGTALTIDLIQADGRHLGGYIIPGMRMMQHMLTQNTRGIEVEPHISDGVGPGQSTRACVSNGSTLAVAALIDRVVSDFRKQTSKNVKCIITGGGAASIQPLLAGDFKNEPDLVLRGISIMSKGMVT